MTKRELALLIAGVFVIGLFAGVALSCVVVLHTAQAEEDVSYCWILCRPGTEVLVREKPGRRATVCGAVSCGAELQTDGREKGGYLHLVNVANETGEGWVHNGYVVYMEPELVYEERVIIGGARVACRKWIDGKRTAWAKDGSTVTVYAVSSGWAVTNKGFIQDRFIGGAE